MATIKEIAKACHVSVATVSNILNKKPGASETTRELVLKTAKEMDYMPNYVAKNLKTKNTRSIGVILLTGLRNTVRKLIIRFYLRIYGCIRSIRMCIMAGKIILKG